MLKRIVKKIASDVVLIIDIIGIIFSAFVFVRDLGYYIDTLDRQWILVCLMCLVILINFIDNLIHDWRRDEDNSKYIDSSYDSPFDLNDCQYRIEDKSGFEKCTHPDSMEGEYCSYCNKEECSYLRKDVGEWKRKWKQKN